MASRLIRAKNSNGQIVNIDSVDKGLNCNCKCPVCDNALIARKGEIRDYHFAHSNGKDCITAPETALHLLAKEIIKENKKLKLSENKDFEYTSVEIEKTIQNYRVDAYVKNEKSDLIIEIFVTHSLENKKIKDLEKDKKPILEIDLSELPYDIPRNELEKEVLDNDMNRTLINWNDKDIDKDNPLQDEKLEDDLTIEEDDNTEIRNSDIVKAALFIAGIFGLSYWVYRMTGKKPVLNSMKKNRKAKARYKKIKQK